MSAFTDTGFLHHSTTKQVVYLELRSHPYLRAAIFANLLHSCVGVFTSLLMVQLYGCSSLGGSEGNHDLGMTFVIWIEELKI